MLVTRYGRLAEERQAAVWRKALYLTAVLSLTRVCSLRATAELVPLEPFLEIELLLPRHQQAHEQIEMAVADGSYCDGLCLSPSFAGGSRRWREC
jgi:hypothetical protein